MKTLDIFCEKCYPNARSGGKWVTRDLTLLCYERRPMRSPFFVWRAAMAVKSFWTKSRVKVLVYTRFRHYKIQVRRSVPKLGPFGEIFYDNTWFLSPKQ